MQSVTDVIECPFCGVHLQLGDLPVVATERRPAGTATTPGNGFAADLAPHLSSGEGGERAARPEDAEWAHRRGPVSGVRPLGWLGEWPVVARAPLKVVQQGSPRRYFPVRQPLPPLLPLDEVARPEDRPARICTSCHNPLPRSLDERDYFTIGIVGVNNASKTTFIASALKAGYYDQGLLALGCTEFELDGPSGDRFYDEYYRRIFVRKHSYQATPRNTGSRIKPLVIKASFPNAERQSLLLFHDVAGDDLSEYGKRLSIAPFVRRADALVFLLDPRWLPAWRGLLPDHGLEDPANEQMHVFSSIVDELSRKEVPVAIALSKVDLLRSLIGDRYRFFTPSPPSRDAWLEDLRVVDAEVRELLASAGAAPLLAKVNHVEGLTFCAISPLGSDPGDDQPIESLSPLRVLDPLAAVLSRVRSLRV